ncbi:Manganese/iron superoxide dismutase [Rhypophila decipiens]|uniref:Manganese/iron superoxide dismutase n=1 Tax=Rhypophila decipiens TaxID=261697 RepID=A0AAN6YB21_9PEZI|nr:Manganese/iron superoxide dismutase [Rhypophila decipiens]
MLRPRLRIPRIGRIAGGLTSTPQLAPLSLPFAQSLQAVQQSRSKHSVPPLKFNTEDGIPGFLTGPSIEMAWTEYQTLMLDKLDQKIAETDFENKDLKSIILSTAREPQYADVFNYASAAHNNAFFFDKLTDRVVEMPETLQKEIEKSFGSVETLRREMVYTANAMFGPGFVWLVKAAHPGMSTSFKVLTTYLAGTPYSGAHWRRQEMDTNTAIGTASPSGIENGRNYLSNAALGISRKQPQTLQRDRVAPGGIDVQPVLCINTWEHVWLRDYSFGVRGNSHEGKIAYCEAWWYRVDWEKVAHEAGFQEKQKKTLLGGDAAEQPKLATSSE